MRAVRDPWAVSKFLRDRNLLNLNPPYQREAGVWSLEKQQLFIDSLLNGYDIPKIYLHQVDRDVAGFDFAVVDGKQRISTVYSFLGDGFGLGDDFSFAGPNCSEPPRPRDTYSQFSREAQELLREVMLDIAVIQTDDEEEIEELFSRLNNGEKLKAAESRNAMGGIITDLIRELIQEPFFVHKLGFNNSRYSYHEVACKLLLLEHHMMSVRAPSQWYMDLKKKHLDSFVKDHRDMSQADAERLLTRVRQTLNDIGGVFEDRDFELSKQSYPQIQYLFVKTILKLYGARDLKMRIRRFLREFTAERRENLSRPEETRDSELIEYGRLMQQGTNDAGSMKSRVDILTHRFLRVNPDVLLKDPRRSFTQEERWALWHRCEKKCEGEGCGKELASIDELDGDHIVWHADGGPTTLANARALCVACNRGARRPE
jgi:hypothetical protein